MTPYQIRPEVIRAAHRRWWSYVLREANEWRKAEAERRGIS